MHGIRDEIRAILREELATLMAEHAGDVEVVRIETSEDLNAFARHLVDQMSSKPKFAGKVKNGEVRFVLERAPAPVPMTPAVPAAHTAAAPARPQGPVLDKKLITEVDLIDVDPGTLRVPHHARITPLAKDEARRRGVRIERIDP